MKKKYKDNNFLEVDKSQVANLLLTNFSELMSGFYEMQSSFLSNLYGRYESIETANIVLCFAKNTHLEIIRQREKYLNHDISFSNFWNNLNSINKPAHKIVDIVKMTGLPKETARISILRRFMFTVDRILIPAIATVPNITIVAPPRTEAGSALRREPT